MGSRFSLPLWGSIRTPVCWRLPKRMHFPADPSDSPWHGRRSGERRTKERRNGRSGISLGGRRRPASGIFRAGSMPGRPRGDELFFRKASTPWIRWSAMWPVGHGVHRDRSAGAYELGRRIGATNRRSFGLRDPLLYGIGFIPIRTSPSQGATPCMPSGPGCVVERFWPTT